MALDLSPDELLSTTRSVRKRLDLSRPVPRDVVQDCIEVALQAPSGSNSQSWHWMVVTDAEKRRALAELYARHFDPYIALSEEASPYPSGDPRADAAPRVSASARYLREHLHEVPVHVIPCQWGRVDGANTFAQASFWGSILPAAWSFMLALRSRGLGSSWTTLHLPSEVEAAEILDIPHAQVTQVGLFPVAYTVGTDFKAAPRIEVSRLIHWDTW